MKNFYIIVGCGGTGSNLAPMLSRMMDESDVMLLIDGDTVSVSNISRQTYQDFDVNKNKARSLAKKLNSCYQHQHFAIDRFLTSSDDLLEIVKNYKTTDIYGGGYGFKYFIIAAVDNNKARLILENAFLRMLKYYPEEISDFGYSPIDIAAHCVIGIKDRIARGDNYSGKVLSDAKAVLIKLLDE